MPPLARSCSGRRDSSRDGGPAVARTKRATSSPIGAAGRRTSASSEVPRPDRQGAATDERRNAPRLLAAMGIDAAGRRRRASPRCDALRARSSARADRPVASSRSATSGARALAARLARRRNGDGALAARTHARARRAARRGEVAARHARRPRHRVPDGPPLGYHDAALTVEPSAREREAEQTLIVVPGRCVRPRDMLGDAARSVSSRTSTPCAATRNWGVGDLTDLATLVEWAGASAAHSSA